MTTHNAGGAATFSGTTYQARVIAYVYAHILARRRLSWIPDTDDIPTAISGETGGPGDDATIELLKGTIDIQAKHGLAGPKKIRDALTRICNSPNSTQMPTHVVLVVNRASGRKTYYDLPLDLERIRSGRRKPLKPHTKRIIADLAEQALCRLYVMPIDVDYASDPESKHALHLLQSVLSAHSDPLAAWSILIADAHSLCAQQLRRDCAALTKLLQGQGLRLAELTTAVADASVPDACSVYLDRLREQFRHLRMLGSNLFLDIASVFIPPRVTPLRSAGSAMLAGPSPALPAVDVFARRSNVFLAGPVGSGKTSLLIWLMRQELIQETLKVPVFARLPTLSAADDLLPQLSLIVSSFGWRPSMEHLHALCQRGDLLLLLDAFDEVPLSKRADYERSIIGFASAYPRCQVVVAGRPGGSECFVASQFERYEIAPLESDDVSKFLKAWSSQPNASPLRRLRSFVASVECGSLRPMRGSRPEDYAADAVRVLYDAEMLSDVFGQGAANHGQALTRNPLALTLICVACDRGEAQFGSVTQLLDGVTVSILERALDTHPRTPRSLGLTLADVLRAAERLGATAFDVETSLPRRTAVSLVAESWRERYDTTDEVATEEIWDVLMGSGLLVSDNDGTCRVAYSPIREYLGARMILAVADHGEMNYANLFRVNMRNVVEHLVALRDFGPHLLEMQDNVGDMRRGDAEINSLLRWAWDRSAREGSDLRPGAVLCYLTLACVRLNAPTLSLGAARVTEEWFRQAQHDLRRHPEYWLIGWDDGKMASLARYVRLPGLVEYLNARDTGDVPDLAMWPAESVARLAGWLLDLELFLYVAGHSRTGHWAPEVLDLQPLQGECLPIELPGELTIDDVLQISARRSSPRDRLDLWDCFIRRHSSSARAYIERGIARRQSGDHGGAQSDLAIGVRIAKRVVHLSEAIGCAGALEDAGESQLAIQLLRVQVARGERIRSTGSPIGKAYAQLGRLLVLQNMYEEGIVAIETALTHEATADWVISWRAYAHMRLGQYTEAIRDYETAVSRHPDFAAGHLRLAELYKRVGDRRLRGALDRACELIRDDPSALLARGQENEGVGQFAEALSDYRQAASIKRTHEGKCGEGRTLYRLGSFDEALCALEEAVRIDGSCVAGRVYLAAALARCGDAERGDEELDRALSNCRDELDRRLARLRWWHLLGRRSEFYSELRDIAAEERGRSIVAGKDYSPYSEEQGFRRLMKSAR